MSEKLGAKFPAITRGYFMVKIACLDDAFLEVFHVTASKLSRRSTTAAKRKEIEKKERRKKKPKRNENPEDVGHFLVERSQNFDFCACTSQNVVRRDASGKKGKLSCCKCLS